MWLDDIRLPPEGATWVKNYDEAIALLQTGRVTEASLDHDLSDFQMRWDTSSGYSEAPYQREEERTGFHVVCWMQENNVWPSLVRVHSANPVGKARMLRVIWDYHPTGGAGPVTPIEPDITGPGPDSDE